MFLLSFLSVCPSVFLLLFLFIFPERESWQPQLPTLVLCPVEIPYAHSLNFVFPYTAPSLVRLWIQLLRQSTELLRVTTHFLREDGLGCSSPEEYSWNVCEMTSWFPPQCLVRLRIQILRQSTETLERAKCSLQPTVMCLLLGPKSYAPLLAPNASVPRKCFIHIVGL